MKQINTLKGLGSLIAATLMVGCSSGGLPSDLNQASQVPNAPTEQYLPLSFTAPSDVVTQGGTLQFAASGGQQPYTFSHSDMLSSTLVFNASTVGTFTLTMTDARNVSASFTVTVSAAPVVQPTPPAETPAPVIETQAVYRHYNNIHGINYNKLEATLTGLGWQSLGEYFRTYRTGGTDMTLLYQCKIPLGVAAAEAYFESTDINCEGQQNVGNLGYVYTVQKAGTVPLVRFSRVYTLEYWGTISDHILLKNMTVANGFTYEGVIGYVQN